MNPVRLVYWISATELNAIDDKTTSIFYIAILWYEILLADYKIENFCLFYKIVLSSSKNKLK